MPPSTLDPHQNIKRISVVYGTRRHLIDRGVVFVNVSKSVRSESKFPLLDDRVQFAFEGNNKDAGKIKGEFAFEGTKDSSTKAQFAFEGQSQEKKEEKSQFAFEYQSNSRDKPQFSFEGPAKEQVFAFEGPAKGHVFAFEGPAKGHVFAFEAKDASIARHHIPEFEYESEIWVSRCFEKALEKIFWTLRNASNGRVNWKEFKRHGWVLCQVQGGGGLFKIAEEDYWSGSLQCPDFSQFIVEALRITFKALARHSHVIDRADHDDVVDAFEYHRNTRGEIAVDVQSSRLNYEEFIAWIIFGMQGLCKADMLEGLLRLFALARGSTPTPTPTPTPTRNPNPTPNPTPNPNPNWRKHWS